MSAQISQRIGVATFCTILFSGLGVSAAANSAHAADCLTAPNAPAPENSHWYYRTDRIQQRKCWYLGAAKEPTGQGSVQIERESVPAKPLHSERAEGSYSLARFKDFIKHRKGGDLSNGDVEGLYAEFLEWKGHTKN